MPHFWLLTLIFELCERQIEFRILYPNGKYRIRTVRTSPTDGAAVIKGTPEDGNVSATAVMNRDVFFDVYWGKLHPRNAVLSGKVQVRGWAFMELYNFGNSFDLSSKKWAACTIECAYSLLAFP